MRTKNIAIGQVVAALLCVLGTAGPVLAGLVPRGTWREVTDDGKYVVVAICRQSLEEELAYQRTNSDAEIRAIRATYPASGLYRNDGSTDPIWTFAVEPWPRSVEIAPDGIHAVLPGGWVDSVGGTVVYLLRNGNVFREYDVEQIIPNLRLKVLANRGYMISCAGVSFDRENMTYTVVTEQGERTVIDVTTGAIVAHDSPWPQIVWSVAAVLAVMFIAVVAWIWTTVRRKHGATIY
jgi:hypothetical protein